MRVFKRKRTVNGKTREDSAYTLEFRTHRDKVARMAAFEDRASSAELGKKVDRLVAARSLNEPPAPDLQVWISSMPADLRNRLADLDILDRQSVSANRPLAEHVEEFRQNLVARGCTPKQCHNVFARTTRVLDLAGFVFAHEIGKDAVEKALAKLKDTGLSQQTINHHVRAVKQFVGWMIENNRMHSNPIAKLRGGNVTADRRLERRELSADEIAWLLKTVPSLKARSLLTGDQRHKLYVVALGTGLRASELRSLTPRSFDLQADPPTVTIHAADEKAGRGADLPLPPDVVAIVKPWLSGKPLDAPLWPGRWSASGEAGEFLRKDLRDAKAAWIKEAESDPAEVERRTKEDFLEYRDSASQQADFHALRHTYLSRLGRSGVPAKVMQKLARHSTVELTIGRYTHASIHDLAGAVERLPPLTPAQPVETHANTMRATGTDGKPMKTPGKANDDDGERDREWTENGPDRVARDGTNEHRLTLWAGSDDDRDPSSKPAKTHENSDTSGVSHEARAHGFGPCEAALETTCPPRGTLVEKAVSDQLQPKADR